MGELEMGLLLGRVLLILYQVLMMVLTQIAEQITMIGGYPIIKSCSVSLMPKTSIQPYHQSSTTSALYSLEAWAVLIGTGRVTTPSKFEGCSVWPVRGGH